MGEVMIGLFRGWRRWSCRHKHMTRTEDFNPLSYLGMNGYAAVVYHCQRCGYEMRQIEVPFSTVKP